MSYGKFAKIYDSLINEDINYNEIADRIKDIIRENNIEKNSYLDLACGTGNVGSIIGKEFKEIYAVDLSQDMLNETFMKFKENRIKGKIICQDMRELSLNKTFDVITCVLDSTNYLTEDGDLEDYLNGVYDHLKNKGIFIFDINSFYKISQVLGNNIFTYSSEEVFYSWENSFQEDVVNMFLTFFVKDDESGLYERFEEEHYERAYTEEFIEDTLKNIGFEMVGKYQGYSNECVENESERILYIVTKNVEE